MKLKWTETALQDLDAIHDYIALDSRFYAERHVQRIILTAAKIKDFPAAGRRVPETDRDDVREVLFQDYRIIYRIKPKRIEVLAVVHGSRDLAKTPNKPWEDD